MPYLLMFFMTKHDCLLLNGIRSNQCKEVTSDDPTCCHNTGVAREIETPLEEFI